MEWSAFRSVSESPSPPGCQRHGFADLKNWRILTKVRMNARHATELLRTLLVLTNAEITR